MLPLPRFRHHRPKTLAEAVELLATLGPDVKLLAGGTDLLPNMKHGLFEPAHVVSLGAIAELTGITVAPDVITIGAMTTLEAIERHARIKALAPALAEAASQVAGPHHRRMGTIGGNICLDTRCVYYNQTYFWREALGFCLKKDGTLCHVVKSGKNCVAAASNDTAPALMVLDATIDLSSPRGSRSVSINEFYNADGINNLNRESDEIVVAVHVPRVSGRYSAFGKIRRRGAIDFPLVNCAFRVDRNEIGDVETADLVVSALAARPKRIKAARKVTGPASSDDDIEAIATSLGEAAFKGSRPLSNIDNDANWRRDMVKPMVAKAVRRALRASPGGAALKHS